jgi:arginine utilization protein RocB
VTSEVGSKVRELALRLTGQRSVSGTPGEASFASFLKGLVAEGSYFKQHPKNVWLEPIEDDPLGRSVVVALVKGSGRRTVILTGHFDTIPTTDYGPLEPFATDPVRLASKITDRLRATEEDAQALEDLSSGRFLPGRGLLDMKSGLAAALVAMTMFAARPRRVGNLLFVAVPDEEDSSVGMRAVAPRLPALAADHGLDLSLAINLDALGDEG